MTSVSVIIPTTGRPTLVVRAVESALAQTHRDLEVIVAVEGPNAETLIALSRVGDPRLRIIEHAQALGAGPARNAAAMAARGEWLAFLDDDDEWLPEKLERQLAAAASDAGVLVSCRCRVVTSRATYVWPRRLYREGEPIDDYLFERRSLTRGEAYLATPTVLMSAALFARTGFGTTSQNEDTTLYLRVTKQAGGRIVMLPDVLAIIHTEQGRASLGTVFSWRSALEWLDANRPLMSRRAYSGFCLVTIVTQAVRARDYSAIPVLLGRAWRHGSPTSVQLALFTTFWLTPPGLRQRLRAWLGSGRTVVANAGGG